jgi:hypothetical protein
VGPLTRYLQLTINKSYFAAILMPSHNGVMLIVADIRGYVR